MYSPFSLKRERLYSVKDKIIIEWNSVNTATNGNRPYAILTLLTGGTP